MTDWLKANFSLGNILTIAVIAAALIAGWARAEYRDVYHDMIIADHEQRIRDHVTNSAIHIDVRRDDQRWADLLERLRRIEQKIDER
jgi:hypothetical protein